MCGRPTITYFLVFYRPPVFMFASTLISIVSLRQDSMKQPIWASFSHWSLLRPRQNLWPCPSVLTLSPPFSWRQSTIAVSRAIPGDQQGWKKVNVKDVYSLIAGESVLVGLRLQPIPRIPRTEGKTEQKRERERDGILDGWDEACQIKITSFSKHRVKSSQGNQHKTGLWENAHFKIKVECFFYQLLHTLLYFCNYVQLIQQVLFDHIFYLR